MERPGNASATDRGVASPPLCPARHPPQSVAACLSRAARRILSSMGTKSRETHLRRIGPGCRQSVRLRRARTADRLGLSRRGTSACSAFRVRRKAA